MAGLGREGRMVMWRNRPAAVLAGLGILSFAGYVMTAGGGAVPGAATHAGAASRYTIEVNEQGFNPELCQVNRLGDEVVWKNTGAQPHQVIVPDVGVDSPPRFDTGEILPGETSQVYSFTGQADLQYHDAKFPTHKGRILVPMSPSASASCTKQAPTPTPTPTRTATPVPTPTPWVIQSAKCRPGLGCAVTQQLARDD